jgi:hypothetical protein
MVVVLMVGALMSVAAFAKVRKHTVTFDTDIKVNDTLVKKGTYQVRYDDETGQLSILQNGKTVAQATTKIEARAKKANDFVLRSVTNGDEKQMIGVTFGGSDKDVLLNTGASGTGSGSN